MGAIHGHFVKIKELYVPTLDLVVNLENDMNVFFSDGKRYMPKAKDSPFRGKGDPKLLKTLILEGAQAENIRNLCEIHLLFKGIKNDAKGVVENILSKDLEKN